MFGVLKDRYAFTEHKKLDWNKIQQAVMAKVDQACAKGGQEGEALYYDALYDLNIHIPDGHFTVNPGEARLVAA